MRNLVYVFVSTLSAVYTFRGIQNLVPPTSYPTEVDADTRTGTLLENNQLLNTTVSADDEHSRQDKTSNTISTNVTQEERQQEQQMIGTPPSRKRYNSALRFVFVVGLEGTGHHFFGHIVHGSPDVKVLMDQGQVEALEEIQLLFFNYKKPKASLWNAHCTGVDANLRRTQSHIVRKLKGMESRAQQTKSNNKHTIHVPLNTAFEPKGVGMISYPNTAMGCRNLNYPALDVLYRICDMARVDCGHVYIYRDPTAIIQSTVNNRHFSDNLKEQIHLYKSMYNIIASEMITYPDRTWGCYGLLDASSISENSTRPVWWNHMKDFWGWTSQEEYDQYMDSIYKRPKPVAKDLIPGDLEPYLYGMYEAHYKVIKLCELTQSGTLGAVLRR